MVFQMLFFTFKCPNVQFQAILMKLNPLHISGLRIVMLGKSQTHQNKMKVSVLHLIGYLSVCRKPNGLLYSGDITDK